MERAGNVRIIPATRRESQKKKVAIYARVSTASREQLNSLAAQVSGLTRYVANRNNWILKDIYMEVGSAKTGSYRSEYTRMLNDCRDNNLDYIITKNLSRFGRDSVEVLKAVRSLMGYGVKLYFMEEDVEFTQYSNELEMTVRAAINQAENEQRSENIRMGLTYRAVNGSSGLYKKPCYGYTNNEEGDLVEDHDQAVVVRKIYNLYLSGSSVSGIIKTLADEQIPSPHGSEFWNKKTISDILTNPKYTGNVEILKTDRRRDSYVMWDTHEAIIQPNDFVKVQKEIEKRTKKKRKYRSSASMLIECIEWPQPQNTADEETESEPINEVDWTV